MGYLRYVFAVAVIFSHFGQSSSSASGQFAVFGFYVLSGFLMTRVPNDWYGFDLRRFALNRFLRLYPLFGLVSMLAVMAISLAPATALQLNPALVVPSDPTEWLSYLSIVPLTQASPARPIPPSWSLAVEIINYGLLWLLTARDRRWAYIALAASVVYHVVVLGLGSPIYWRYAPSWAAVLPFTVGALVHHEGARFRVALSSSQCRGLVGLVGAVWLGLVAWGQTMPPTGFYNALYYCNIAVVAALAALLSAIPLSDRMKRSDRVVGDLAYPIFLGHWAVGVPLSAFLLHSTGRGPIAFATITLATTLLALPLAWMGEMVIEPVRDRVRRRVSAGADSYRP